MQKLLLLLFLIFFSVKFSFSQTVIKSSEESKEAFIKRIAPTNAIEVKLLLEDKLNSSSPKIIYTYSMMKTSIVCKHLKLRAVTFIL
jgi:hypothetical protein